MCNQEAILSDLSTISAPPLMPSRASSHRSRACLSVPEVTDQGLQESSKLSTLMLHHVILSALRDPCSLLRQLPAALPRVAKPTPRPPPLTHRTTSTMPVSTPQAPYSPPSNLPPSLSSSPATRARAKPRAPNNSMPSSRRASPPPPRTPT